MEAFTNLLQFPLAAQCLATDKYLTLAAGDFAKLPTLGGGMTMRLYCDNEWMIAYALDAANNRVYVARGMEGSAAALHPSGRAVLHVASAGTQDVQKAVIDEANSAPSWYDTLTNSMGQIGGMAVWVPAGISFELEFEGNITIYQNAQPALGEFDCDFAIKSLTSGQVQGGLAVLGGGATYRQRMVCFASSTGHIWSQPVRFSIPLWPLATPDIFGVSALCDASGGAVCRLSEVGPSKFTARVA